MTRTPPFRSPVALAATLLTVLAGCGTTGGPHSVRTGPGVTDTTIKLGVLIDLSGPYGPPGRSMLRAERLYMEKVNADGGICGRKLKLVIRDHGYDAGKAFSQYREIQPSIAAMPGLLGSSIINNALIVDIADDGLMTTGLGYSSALLGQPTLQLVDSTFDIDMVNGFGHLVSTYGLKPGDKVGYIYVKGDYGSNALLGAKFAAREHELTLVGQEVKFTDRDMSPQVRALGEAGVKAVVVSTSPGQTASAVGVAAAQGLTVPFLAGAASYHPQLLETPAAPALLNMLQVVSPLPALDGGDAEVERLVADYRAKYPGQPLDQAVETGHNAMAVTVQDLREACAAKDLSREGISAAHRRQTGFDPGIGPALDFSDSWRPSATESYVLKPDKGAPGGLTGVKGPFKVPAVEEYIAAMA
ncbi:ABC transporter substrate-binding protein [Streptomyces sp. NPDC001070]